MPTGSPKASHAAMTVSGTQDMAATGVVLSVDAMGGDQGPQAVIGGLAHACRLIPDVRFIVHGDEGVLGALIARTPELAARCTVRHAPRVVGMGDKPSQVMRHGQGTSMWACIEALREGEAQGAVSCGNTGALMAIAMVRLRRLPGVARPAIACLWPSRNAQGFNVMLDVGADVRAEPADLAQYAMMGAAYARNGLGLARPRVGLLNVGTEEHKGRAEMKAALDLIVATADAGQFEATGFVEGGDIPSDRVDVIVTDGFTGNVALKTGEGTAKLIQDLLRQALGGSWLARLGALLALGSLRRLQRRIDPRRVNGGVFLGLNGTVVKSHGAADATGVAAALQLAFRLARSGFHEGLAAQIASAAAAGQTEGESDEASGGPA
jgi:glycerol-3-phosphate acyltransferase PlsX